MLSRSSLINGLNYASLNRTISQLNNQKQLKSTSSIFNPINLEPTRQLNISAMNRIKQLSNRQESIEEKHSRISKFVNIMIENKFEQNNLNASKRINPESTEGIAK